VSGRILGYLVFVVICLPVLAVGCKTSRQTKSELKVPKAQEAIKKGETPKVEPVRQVVSDLALKFEQGSVRRYRIVDEMVKDYKYERPMQDKVEKKKMLLRTEIEFSEEIKNINDNGEAIAKITIDNLKRYSRGPRGMRMDFDSRRAKDKKRPLAKLLGRSYTIKINPAGRAEVIDANAVRDVIKGGVSGKLAADILSDKSIIKRHSILALPQGRRGELKVGDKWSLVEDSPQGMLEAKSYEKIYRLKQVKSRAGEQLAVVTMKAIPSDKAVSGALEDKVDLSGVDSSDLFEGSLVVNLDTGRVEEYYEKLIAEWIAAERPQSSNQEEPDVLTVGFTYLHRMETLD